MQIPLLYGVGATEAAEFIQTVPLNLEPIILDNKISKGQLRQAWGTVPFAVGPGVDRGGINWNGACYRVMGTSLVRVNADATIDTLGDVGGVDPCTFTYGFDRLAIRSDTNLYYWDGTALTQVTDEDLGTVIDLIWIDGFFMTTDGTYVVVTELSDPTSVKPLKYGSAEEDPDAVTGLIKFSDEAYVLGQYTIQVFQNVGGNGFPFAPVRGGTIPYGCVGPLAKTLFGGSFAFVGSAKNEALGVFMAGQGVATKISNREMDDALAAAEDTVTIVLDNRVSKDEARLFVHLPTETWVFMLHASHKVGEPVWYRLQSGAGNPYRLRHPVNVYGQTMVGDTQTSGLGTLSDTVSSQFGEAAQWQFDAGLLYNDAKGVIVHSVELVGLPGRGNGTIFLSMTQDGETYSPERALSYTLGDRNKRLQWRPHTRFAQRMGLRFRGYDTAVNGFAAIELTAAPLTV